MLPSIGVLFNLFKLEETRSPDHSPGSTVNHTDFLLQTSLPSSIALSSFLTSAGTPFEPQATPVRDAGKLPTQHQPRNRKLRGNPHSQTAKYRRENLRH